MLNRIDIMGKLVADPEMRFTGGGIPVCTFRIACERDFAAAGAQKETDFIDCVTWREKAEFVNKYFSKGMPILVSLPAAKSAAVSRLPRPTNTAGSAWDRKRNPSPFEPKARGQRSRVGAGAASISPGRW